MNTFLLSLCASMIYLLIDIFSINLDNYGFPKRLKVFEILRLICLSSGADRKREDIVASRS